MEAFFAGNRRRQHYNVGDRRRWKSAPLLNRKDRGKTPRDFQMFSDFLVANQVQTALRCCISTGRKKTRKTAIRADAVRPTCICKLWKICSGFYKDCVHEQVTKPGPESAELQGWIANARLDSDSDAVPAESKNRKRQYDPFVLPLSVI